jgi:excisionase family DNA binding protein
MVPAKEAARITNRSVLTLSRMASAGEIQVYRVRRNLFYKRSDLDALFQPVVPKGGAR